MNQFLVHQAAIGGTSKGELDVGCPLMMQGILAHPCIPPENSPSARADHVQGAEWGGCTFCLSGLQGYSDGPTYVVHGCNLHLTNPYRLFQEIAACISPDWRQLAFSFGSNARVHMFLALF